MSSKPRTSRRGIAELAYVLRALLRDIEAAGSKNVAAHHAALAVVDACVRGEQPTPAAIQAARAAVTKACERYANAYKLPPIMAALYALPIVNLLWMVESGQESAANIVADAARAVLGADAAARRRRIEDLLAEARRHAATIDDGPFWPRKKEVDADARAAERALLERSRAALSGDALALFDAIGPARDADKIAPRARLTERLTKLGYPLSDALLAFEESFGGLCIPVSADAEWREDRVYTCIGAWATVEPDHRWRQSDDDPPGPLVPVAYGLQDDVYLLDVRGGAWYHDPTGATFVVPFGADGAELVTRLVMAAFTYASHAPQGTPLWPPVAVAHTAAAALGLRRLFADERSEWWYAPCATVVVFQGKVYALARSEEAAAALRASP